jgi:hypothetical protein
MVCKKSQFTVLNRRHHCRKCGAVVCGPCSNKKFLLPSQSSKPLRVCSTCYDVLSTGGGGGASGAGGDRRRDPQAGNSSFGSSSLNESKNRTNSSSGEEDSDEDDDDPRAVQTAQPGLDVQASLRTTKEKSRTAVSTFSSNDTFFYQ